MKPIEPYNRNPFIKKFQTKNGRYIYDVNSNKIVKVTPLVFDILEDTFTLSREDLVKKYQTKYDAQEIKELYNELRTICLPKGLFSNHRPAISTNIDSEEKVTSLLDSQLNQLILMITNRCNLNCKYCIFPSQDQNPSPNRVRDLSLKNAKKAIEFFIRRSGSYNDGKKPAITFYGGEPLLKFGFMKELIEFTKQSGVFENFRFSFTTNGTLLSKRVIEYLLDNRISILISLDGPDKIHDKNRKSKNGTGSFFPVIKNLKKIKQMSREYFVKHISINAVISPPYHFKNTLDFFYENDLFREIKDRIGLELVSNPRNEDIFDLNSPYNKKRLRTQVESLSNHFKNTLIRGTFNKHPIECKILLETYSNIENRIITPLGEIFPPIGTCIPGQRRLLVDTDGKFYMCEKVGDNYSIGDVDRGLDLNKIYLFLKQFDHFFQDCSHCWALRLCIKCFNNVRKGDQFDENRKGQMCVDKRISIETSLRNYCEILEKNPEAFEKLKNIKYI